MPLEFPKTMYLHPKDKKQDAASLLVDTKEEQEKAEEKGYTTEPFVKAFEEDEKFDADKQPVSKEAIKKEVAEDAKPEEQKESEKNGEKPVVEKHEADEAKGDSSASGLQQGVEPGELPPTGIV